MLDTSQVQVQLFSVTSSNRVEETDALDETTVTGVTAVSNYYLVERTLFAPPRCKRMVTISSS